MHPPARPDTHGVRPLTGRDGGGSCGKPCFPLPYTLTWTEVNTQTLEQLAAEFGCFVEYGIYPHLKLHDGGQEGAAVPDWMPFAMVYLRPGYEQAEELLIALRDGLAPEAG